MSETFSLLSPREQRQLADHEATIAPHDFILRWTTHGTQRTDAPSEFHRAVAITLASTAIDRHRWLELEHKTVHPSVYHLCLARSGQRKSTPINYGEALLAEWPEVVLANEYSPEALVKHLDSRKPSHGTLFADEAGRLFTTMQRRGYGEALKDILSALWDSPVRYARQLSQASYALTDVYLNLYLATTLSRVVETLQPEDIASGFLARFLPIVVTAPTVRKPLRSRTPETQAEATRLAESLSHIRDSLAKDPKAYPIADGALDRLDHAEQDLGAWADREFEDDLLQPWARRLAEYGSRLAIIFAASESASSIESPHVRRAIAVVDHAKDGALHIVNELRMGAHARNQERFRRFVLANPGLSKRDAQRKTHWPAKEIEAVATELEGLALIRIEPVERSSVRYWPVSDDMAACEPQRGGGGPA